MKEQTSFTEGKILAPLIRFALPVLLALFLQAMYGAVDLLIVGQFGASTDVSAVSTGSQIMHTVTVVIVGLSMGITILAAQKIGENRPEEAGKVIGSGISLFSAVTIAVTVLMVFLASPMSAWMHAPEEAFDQTVSYVRICSAGTVFIVAYNVLGSVFRGIGDSKMPLITVAIACLLNIGGDLLLVGGFHMGVAGAAYATVFAQAFSVLLSVLIIRKKTLPFEFSRKSIRFDKRIIGRIVVLGLPIALQDLLVSVSFLVIIAIVNSLGVVASAGIGVAEKLCAFIMLVPSAYMQAMSAFVAQNIGAKKPDRAKRALAYGIASSVAAGLIMAYISFFHGNLLAGLFSRDGAVIAASADYLRAYAIDCIFTAFSFCFAGYFNGCGKTVFVMLQGLAGAFAVRIPVSYLMSRIPGISLFGIGLAVPASTLLQIVLCVAYLLYMESERRKSLAVS
ncbi:MAG: MATE family efflux transporter [Lachnospiraceae bacterium]